jgi:hypothetical protein
MLNKMGQSLLVFGFVARTGVNDYTQMRHTSALLSMNKAYSILQFVILIGHLRDWMNLRI